MGAHKASPPDLPEEPVTDAFVEAVLKKLMSNRLHNDASGFRRGDAGYRIASHAELAEALDPDSVNMKSMLNRIIGPAKASTKAPKRVATSRYVSAIRDALELPHPKMVSLEVPAERAAILALIATLDDDLFAVLASAASRTRK